MIICDICKRVDHKKHKPHDVSLSVVKSEEKSKKVVDREMIKIPMAICESCITDFLQQLGGWINQIRNERPLPPTSVDRSEEYLRIEGYSPGDQFAPEKPVV